MNQLLSWLLFIPSFAAVLIFLLPLRRGSAAWPIATVASGLVAVIASVVWGSFDAGAAATYLHIKKPWLPQMGIHYEIAIDGLNLPLVLLTAWLTPLALIASQALVPNDAGVRKKMAALILVMETGALGTFLSQDLFLFYVFWEVILIPAYLLIGMYGGPERGRATLQFFLYTFAGSLFMLLAIGWIIYAQYTSTGVSSASISAVRELQSQFDPNAGWAGLLSTQGLLFAGFAIAFFIKSPLVPFHAWLPSTYTQAPTLVSIYLAAILSKMGTYGILKILLPLFPEASQAYAPFLMWLAAIGIVYGALLAIAQKNLKSVIAYSSLSHVSYILLGLFSLQAAGLGGALLQMVNHGIAIAGLFFIAGLLEKKRGSLELSAFGGWAKVTPVLATAFMICVLSSVALPGTNGFVGEFMVLVASFKVDAFATTLAASGMVLGAVYMLNIYQKTMFGKGDVAEVKASDLTVRESLVMAALAFMIIAIGLAPQAYVSKSRTAVEETSKRVQDGTSDSKDEMPPQVTGF